MSERTRALENAASRALLDFVRDPTEAKADAADNVVWRIAESIIAKVNENVMGEIETVRRLTFAKPGETTVGAVKRLVRERDGMMTKYKAARDDWDEERARLSGVIESAHDYLASLDGHKCDSPEACPRCRLALALEEVSE